MTTIDERHVRLAQSGSSNDVPSCPGCGYSLKRLPVSDGAILCPECGRTSALEELQSYPAAPIWIQVLVACWPALMTVLIALLSVVLPYRGRPFTYLLILYHAVSDSPMTFRWFIKMSPLHVTATLVTAVAVFFAFLARRKAMRASWWFVLALALPVNSLSFYASFRWILFPLRAGWFLD